jgi:putative thioredoxin
MSDSAYIFDVDAGNFADIVVQNSQQVPVLVDFWAEWCGPCQSLMPLLAKLAEEFQGKFILAKVNSDQQQELAAQFGVRSLPTVMVFRHGEMVDQFMGALPESDIRKLLAKHIARESDAMLEKALEILAAGDVDTALQMMRDAAASDPENFTIHKTYARVLIETGNPDDAAAVLKALPADVRLEDDVKALEASLEFIDIASAHPDVKLLLANIEKDAADCESRYALAAHKLLHGDMDGAMEQLFEVMKRDRAFHDDAGHKGLLRVFELLGNQGELVSKYRKLMARVLF